MLDRHALFAAFAALAVVSCSSPPHRPVLPNVLVILADDMGWGDPRCFNPNSRIATPCIDRLAAEGMRFTDAHSPGAWCTPTRFGLLTGRYPCRRHSSGWGKRCIEDGRATIASMLASYGYRTAMVGKWHLGFDGGYRNREDWSQPLVGGPLDCGFESWFGIPSSLDIPPYYWIRDRHVVAAPSETVVASNSDGWTKIQGAFWRGGGAAPGFRHADVLPAVERESIAAVTVEDDRPFFVYVALPAPHTPWLPGREWAGRSEASLYGDFVMQVDATVGAIVDAVDQSGRGDDTLIVFTSDNGPVWYPADVDRTEHRSTGPFRGMKSDAWEGGHRMPFVARWPGVVAPGSEYAEVICFTDLFAALAELVDAPLPADLDSVSFVPALRGDNAPTREVTLLKANATVVRAGRWKLITHRGSGGFSKPRRIQPKSGEPKGQLYDLVADPGETNNLWNLHPAVVARLLAELPSR